MDDRWRIQLLGGLRAARGTREVAHFRTRKTGELLAYLALYRHRTHPRELLVELLWPECDLEKGRHNLSVALSALRQQLEVPDADDGAVIQADRFSVGLNSSAYTYRPPCASRSTSASFTAGSAPSC